MTPREILIAARAVLSGPKAWTKKAFARNTYGVRIRPTAVSATCFCMIGAIDHVAPTGPEKFDAKRELTCAIPGGRAVTDFNDDPRTTQADVLAVFDRAIEAINDPA